MPVLSWVARPSAVFWGMVAAIGIALYQPVAHSATPPVPSSAGKSAQTATATGKRQANPPVTAVAMKMAVASHPFPDRVPAPPLQGGVEWLNAAGPIDLKDLRGKFVLLDFWTYCCINCMHILPELKKLEQKYPNNLVVIGVHSAKFETEQDSESIRQAVLRYEIEHPIINDANHKLWQSYRCESWPSLRMIDPEGNVIASNGGEIQFELLNEFMNKALPYYRQHNLLDERPVHFDLEHRKAAETPLRFPGKILADEKGGRLFIADSNHNRIVVASLEGEVRQIIGSGEIGASDGDFKTAQFNHPQGMALNGEMLYVADTENHLIRKVDLKSQKVKTVAGTGMQSAESRGQVSPTKLGHKTSSPKKADLSSPWALCIHLKDLYIAMAGSHQIWKMPLDESRIGPFAGNGVEDIVDGQLLPPRPYELGYSSFAQPSGLSADDTTLYVADSEGSSIRAVPFVARGNVSTIVGTARLSEARLFTFGDVDGRGPAVRLQHCLDVALHDNKLYVADTYNHKIKVIDLKSLECKTLAGTGKPGRDDNFIGAKATLFEPAGLTYADNKLYVADTNNHSIRVIDLSNQNPVTTLRLPGLAAPEIAMPKPAAVPKKPNFDDAHQEKFAQAVLKPDADGKIHLAVKLNLPKGYKINVLAPMRYYLEAADKSGPIDRSALDKLVALPTPAVQFDVPLPVNYNSGSRETLKLSFRYYYCQSGAEGLCKIGSVTMTVPIQLSANATTSAVDLPFTVEQ